MINQKKSCRVSFLFRFPFGACKRFLQIQPSKKAQSDPYSSPAIVSASSSSILTSSESSA